MKIILFGLLFAFGGCFLGITCMCLVISGKRFDEEAEKLVAKNNEQEKEHSENASEYSCGGGFSG